MFLFEILPNETDPVLDHLAQIALEVAKLWSEQARKAGIDLKRLKYVRKEPEDEEEKEELSGQERMRRSKAAWSAMLGVSMSFKKVELPDKVKERTKKWKEHGI